MDETGEDKCGRDLFERDHILGVIAEVGNLVTTGYVLLYEEGSRVRYLPKCTFLGRDLSWTVP